MKATIQSFVIRYLIMPLVLIAFCAPVKAQLNNNGATVVMDANTYLVVENIDLQNNGTFAQTAGTVKFTGSSNSYISGSISPQFYNVELNKTGASLLLQNNLTINNQLLFTDGLLNLNNYNITLNAAAALSGESETSRITGTTGGYIQITSNLNAPSAVNPGNLGAVITSAQNLGTTVIRRGHISQVNGGGTGSSVFRYYDITPANNTALNATVAINYFDAELNSLDENTITVWTSPNTTTWTNIGADARNTATNVITKTGIASFARLTLSSPNNALPLQWSSFNTNCVSNGVAIHFKTWQENGTNVFYIRRSSDGASWQTIATLPAAGNSNTPVSYAYTDQQAFTGAYYRIEEVDMNGVQTLSPVLQSNCAISDVVTVYPNPTYGNALVSLQTTSSAPVMLRLYDAKGLLVQQQLQSVQDGVNQLPLPMNSLAHGMYNLVISWGNGKVKTIQIEKL